MLVAIDSMCVCFIPACQLASTAQLVKKLWRSTINRRCTAFTGGPTVGRAALRLCRGALRHVEDVLAVPKPHMLAALSRVGASKQRWSAE
jgi:hypothetical protein